MPLVKGVYLFLLVFVRNQTLKKIMFGIRLIIIILNRAVNINVLHVVLQRKGVGFSRYL